MIEGGGGEGGFQLLPGADPGEARFYADAGA